jgi:hypothetical protein
VFRVSLADKLLPLNNALFVESKPIPLKWARHQMGVVAQHLQKYHQQMRAASALAGIDLEDAA